MSPVEVPGGRLFQGERVLVQQIFRVVEFSQKEAAALEREIAQRATLVSTHFVIPTCQHKESFSFDNLIETGLKKTQAAVTSSLRLKGAL